MLSPQTETRSFHLPEARAGSKTDTEFAVNPGDAPGVRTAQHGASPGLSRENNLPGVPKHPQNCGSWMGLRCKGSSGAGKSLAIDPCRNLNTSREAQKQTSRLFSVPSVGGGCGADGGPPETEPPSPAPAPNPSPPGDLSSGRIRPASCEPVRSFCVQSGGLGLEGTPQASTQQTLRNGRLTSFTEPLFLAK